MIYTLETINLDGIGYSFSANHIEYLHGKLSSSQKYSDLNWKIKYYSAATKYFVCPLLREGIITIGEMGETDYQVHITEHGIDILKLLEL